MENYKDKCCGHHRFPIFAGVVLVISLCWLLADLKVIALDLPWLPIILTVVSASMIFKFCYMRKMMEKKE